MFVNFSDWPPPPGEPPPPPRPRRRMGAGEERVILWVVGVNLLLLFMAPIAGGSVLGLLWALFR